MTAKTDETARREKTTSRGVTTTIGWTTDGEGERANQVTVDCPHGTTTTTPPATDDEHRVVAYVAHENALRCGCAVLTAEEEGAAGTLLRSTPTPPAVRPEEPSAARSIWLGHAEGYDAATFMNALDSAVYCALGPCGDYSGCLHRLVDIKFSTLNAGGDLGFLRTALVIAVCPTEEAINEDLRAAARMA